MESLWDEHRWEAHLNEMERISGKRKLFINSSWGESEPVWLRFLKEYEDVESALESYIDDELSYEEAYFPDDVDELGEDDDVDEDVFLTYESLEDESDDETDAYILDPGEEIEFFEEYEEDDLDDGEGWKENLTDEEIIEAYWLETDPFDTFYVYDESREISLYFLKRTIEYPDALLSQTYLDFMQEVLQTTSRIAGALAFNHAEVTYIGAIITYCKRAIKHANKALELIRVLKNDEIITEREYPAIYTRLFELRNELGLLIQDMRDFLNKFKTQ